MCRWTGEEFAPLPHYRKRCDRDLVVGQLYTMEITEERSEKSHGHMFAWLHEAWKNLPEHIAPLYPTETHLRRRALIEAGFFDEELYTFDTLEDAVQFKSYLKRRDEFAWVLVSGAWGKIHLNVRYAKSQAWSKMKKKEFQASKTAMMAVVADLIGVTTDELQANAGRAA